jgi:hypothetical protein
MDRLTRIFLRLHSSQATATLVRRRLGTGSTVLGGGELVSGEVVGLAASIRT